jgi:phospholipid transport system substrate-binding protein
MTPHISRRTFVTGACASFMLFPAFGVQAAAVDEARRLVDLLVADVNAVIASGQPEAQMLRQFEVIFDRYADVPTIARYALGRVSPAPTPQQLQRFTAAYKTYVARKYGRRFREFIGGSIEVRAAREVPNGIEVETMAVLRGQSPFRVDFLVSDRSGQTLFFNIIIEGINMLLSERTEIQAMLDQRRGNIDALIADLPQT